MIAAVSNIRDTLNRLRTAAESLGEVRFMEVCGTHTVNAFRSGLHSLVPSNVTLLSGPGCPICVTSQGDIDQLIELALMPGVTMCTYGDMLRVTGRRGSLETARAEGADVRIVYSALDAVRIGADQPRRQVVFAAVGFETTAPATAVAVLEARRLRLNNFTIHASHKLIIPAMRGLLAKRVNLHGFLCPGHVAAIIGSDAFHPIVDDYGMSCVIAGFEGAEIATALARLCELAAEGRPALENLYPQVVSAGGNRCAQQLLGEVFESTTVRWRGLGELPDSGLVLREQFCRFDARDRFGLIETSNDEPPGCRCGDVITGRATPADCKLFGRACTPIDPVGPCMVSSEGTCQAWFKYRRAARTTPQEARP